MISLLLSLDSENNKKLVVTGKVVMKKSMSIGRMSVGQTRFH